MLSTVEIAQAFEAMMMICFGASWPFAILKTWRSKRVEGKSFLFLALVFVGYLAGIVAKLLQAAARHNPPDYVTALYAINALLVAIDICLYLKFRAKSPPQDSNTPILP